MLFARTLRAQARNPAIADEDRTDLGVAALGWWRHFEIENADAETLFTVVSATVTRSEHDALFRSLFPAQINHRMRDRRIPIDAVGAPPEEQIARLERIKFE